MRHSWQPLLPHFESTRDSTCMKSKGTTSCQRHAPFLTATLAPLRLHTRQHLHEKQRHDRLSETCTILDSHYCPTLRVHARQHLHEKKAKADKPSKTCSRACAVAVYQNWQFSLSIIRRLTYQLNTQAVGYNTCSD